MISQGLCWSRSCNVQGQRHWSLSSVALELWPTELLLGNSSVLPSRSQWPCQPYVGQVQYLPYESHSDVWTGVTNSSAELRISWPAVSILQTYISGAVEWQNCVWQSCNNEHCIGRMYSSPRATPNYPSQFGWPYQCSYVISDSPRPTWSLGKYSQTLQEPCQVLLIEPSVNEVHQQCYDIRLIG